MPSVYADRVKETSTSTSTTTITLAGASTGFRSFSSAFSIGDSGIRVFFGDANNGSNWMVCRCTYSAINTLTVDSIESSSAGGAAPSFNAGIKDVFVTVSSSQMLDLLSKTATQITEIADTTIAYLPIVVGNEQRLIAVDKFLAAVSVTPNELPDAGALAGTDILTISQNGADTSKIPLSVLAEFLGATGEPAPVYTITVNTPTAQTEDVAFDVTGTYANGTPTALQYSLNGGSTWSNAPSPTISGGTYSFSITVADPNASLTVRVRDTNNISVYGTSGMFAVNAAPTGPTFKFNGHYGSSFATTMNFGPTGNYAGQSPSIYVLNSDNSGIDFNTYDVWMAFADSSTVKPTRNDAAHTRDSNSYLKCANIGSVAGLAGASNLFTYKDVGGGMNPRYLWIIVKAKNALATDADVWAKAFDGMNTGTPVAITMQAQ